MLANQPHWSGESAGAPSARVSMWGSTEVIEPLATNEPPIIGRYRTLGVLGAGGMGRVLLGSGPDGRFVAIKQIHPHLLDDSDFRARFAREVSISTRVSGAFTAAVVDFDIGENPWLASAFIAGVPLDRAVRDLGPLPVAALRMLASGLASALHSIHGAGLVHRDLKPANVILAADGPRVIDFGIAHAGESSAQLTETGAVVGSPAYMSPEQAMSGPVTAAGDVFSLGSLLVMAATGQSPFAATSAPYTLFNIVHSEPQLDAVPPELRELIGACLRKDPAARPTAAQILDYLGVLPVQAQPWPASIHAEIAEQSRFLVSLTSDPEATQIISSFAIPQASALPPDPARKRYRSRLTLALAVVTAVVITGTVGAVLLRGEEPAVRASPAAVLPSMAQLREIDACSWLPQALGASLPDDLVSGGQAEIAQWRWQQTSSWGCEGTSAAARITIEIGTATDGFTPTGAQTNGFAVQRSGSECLFGIDNGTATGRWGISLSTAERTTCALAEYALDRLAATIAAAPRRPAALRTLATLDPCALASDAEITAAGAAVPGSGVAHTCEWRGASTVRLTLAVPRREDLPTFLRKTFDVGDGVVFEELNAADAMTDCPRLYRFRDIGESYVEAVTVQVTRPTGQPDAGLCADTETVLKAIVGRLPR
ncbi:serine/threonine-protein kinase [Nocardia sp. NPDC058633]|uniref:serine/threonine-protein kinase n=1 Tax=Nocardia sp. NPDC058633 TaxID=3346568 RepID=UPI003656148F